MAPSSPSAVTGKRRQRARAPIYGQVVVGPPGSGKTTYCDGMQQYLRLLGRDAWVINLDPANEGEPASATTASTAVNKTDNNSNKSKAKPGVEKQEEVPTLDLPYETLFDVCEQVVHLTAVMKETGLGPNGGLMYCMEYLAAHVDEIIEGIQEKIEEHYDATRQLAENNNTIKKATGPLYLLLDLPGQVELYTHSTCVQHVLERLVKHMDLRLTLVQLVDAHYCTDPSKFLSAALLGTTTMLRLELPTVNVLSKIDLLMTSYGGEDSLPLTLQYFTECHDLDRLLPFLDSPHVAVDAPRQRKSNDNKNNNDNSMEDDDAMEWTVADDPEFQAAQQKRRNGRMNRKFTKLYASLAEVIDDYGLLSFLPLDISSAESVGRVLAKIDKSNGYIFLSAASSSMSVSSSNQRGDGGMSSVNQDLFQCAMQADDPLHPSDYLEDVKERIARSSSAPSPHR